MVNSQNKATTADISEGDMLEICHQNHAYGGEKGADVTVYGQFALLAFRKYACASNCFPQT